MATSTQAGAFSLQAGERPTSLRRAIGYVVLAGLVNAAIVSFLFIRLPADHSPSLRSLLIRAMIYVAFAVLAGMGGARFYWNRFSLPFKTVPPLSFMLFALVNAATWVWVPAIVLLSRQDSPGSSALAALGAAVLAIGLRGMIPSASNALDRHAAITESNGGGLFSSTLLKPEHEAHGYLIALCVYAAGYFLIKGFYLNAGGTLAVGAYVFAWKRTLEPESRFGEEVGRRGAVHRFAFCAVAAVLATLFAMLFGIGHRNRAEAARLAFAAGNGAGDETGKDRRRVNGVYVAGIDGYESIILWPVPEKAQIVAPVLPSISPLSTRTAKPMVIKFDGPYWYFQPPGQGPGTHPHEGHGTPLSVNIEANNFVPLNMKAEQDLGSSIRLSRCGEVRVMVENRDNRRGAIGLGVVLTDSSAPGKPSVSLGQQQIVSSLPEQFAIKVSPVDEVLRFAVPEHAGLRKFDRITVEYFPGAEHWQVGAKVAVEQFELMPR